MSGHARLSIQLKLGETCSDVLQNTVPMNDLKEGVYARTDKYSCRGTTKSMLP
jgi:hypothetical protein